MCPAIWQRLPDITPNYGASSRSRPSASIPLSSRERLVILRTNPGHDRLLTARLDYLAVERSRAARQLELIRHDFIERQARKQRRLDEAGVTTVTLLPASLMLESDLTSLVKHQHQQPTGTGSSNGTENVSGRRLLARLPAHVIATPNFNALFGQQRSLAYTTDMQIDENNNIVLPGDTNPASTAGKSSESPTKSVQFSDGFYSGSDVTGTRLKIEAVLPSVDRDVTAMTVTSYSETSPLRHSVEPAVHRQQRGIRKRGLPTLIEQIDVNNAPISADADPRFVQLIDSLRCGGSLA